MSISGCNCNNCEIGKCTSRENEKENQLKIILAGNPNVGKSVIFNALSGFYVEVSNFPGTTVDVSHAFIEEGEIIDTPGAYSIGDYSDDELVTKKIIQTADVVINVISAISLERDLFLTQQLIDMDFPLIIAINQVDEAKSRGMKIDYEKLQERLGVKVIPTIAIHKQGISDILKSIKNGCYKNSQNKITVIKELFSDQNLSRCERFKKLNAIEAKQSCNTELKEEIFAQRRKKVTEVLDNLILEEKNKFDISTFLGNLLLNPIAGSLTALFMLFVLYQFIGVWVAGGLVDKMFNWTQEHYSPWISTLIRDIIPANFINELLVGEFGVLTMTVELIGGLLLPLIIAFYLFMAILEDTGYLPRLAVLTDNLLSKLGMNGRAVIPLILGFGCCTMGIITTRILGSKKERIIASALLGLTIPCSAQIGIIVALMATIGGIKTWFLYIFTIFSVMVLAGTLLNKLIKGSASDLLIDLPPLRLPVLGNTFNKTFFRVINFLKEATPLFLVGSFFIGILNLTGALHLLQRALSPIVVNLLNLPEQFADVFVMGMIRRDFGSVGILQMAGLEGKEAILDPIQIFVSAVVVTLFVPCFAALIVIFKERGWKEAVGIWLGSFVISILIGSILIRVLPMIIS